MPSSAVIRVQQQQPPSAGNPTTSTHQSDKQTISMFRLFLRAFDYIYLINTKLVLYILFMFKRVLRFIFGLWTFLFVSLRGSKKKVGYKQHYTTHSVDFSLSFSSFNFNLLNITTVLSNRCLFIDSVGSSRPELS